MLVWFYSIVFTIFAEFWLNKTRAQTCKIGPKYTRLCSATYMVTSWHCQHSPAAAVAVDRYLLPAGPTAANLQRRFCCCGKCGPILRQTYGRLPCRVIDLLSIMSASPGVLISCVFRIKTHTCCQYDYGFDQQTAYRYWTTVSQRDKCYDKEKSLCEWV